MKKIMFVIPAEKAVRKDKKFCSSPSKTPVLDGYYLTKFNFEGNFAPKTGVLEAGKVLIDFLHRLGSWNDSN